MRELITRSFVLLWATAMIAIAVANNAGTAGVKAKRLDSRKAETSIPGSALNASGPATLSNVADPNPLLANWEGRYGGVPPFDRVQIALFKPALEEAMTEQLAETDRIAKNP